MSAVLLFELRLSLFTERLLLVKSSIPLTDDAVLLLGTLHIKLQYAVEPGGHMNPQSHSTSNVNLRETSKAWHTVLLCLFITVAHIHIKRILTFGLILECVHWVFVFFSHVYPLYPLPHPLPCLVPSSSSPSILGLCDLSPPSVGLKWHQLLSPFSIREWCSVFSTSPHSCRERRLNLNTVHFLFMDLCLLEMFFVLLLLFFFFFVLALENGNLHVINLKYTT